MKVLIWMGGNFDRRTPSEHLFVAIVEALYNSGNTVHIIQKDTGGPLPKLPKELDKLGVTTDCIACKLAAKNNFIARYIVELKYIWKSIKYIKKHKDCEAVFNQSSNVAGIMAFVIKHIMPKARLTYNVQDIFPENAFYIGSIKKIVYNILSFQQKYAYHHSDQIITISEDMKNLLIEKGAPSEKVEVVYNWSYSDELYQKENMYNAEIAKYLSDDKFNVVYAGNIGTMQNVELLINTARIMQEELGIQFHIFGDGVFKQTLKQNAQDLSNVHFWPMQDAVLAPSIYSMADVNIIPLAKNIYRTALPSKTATCIACQRPIVFCIGKESKFGKKIIKQKGCYVIDSNNAEQLKNIILEIEKTPVCVDTTSIFKRDFQKSTNSRKYSNLITKIK